jgi:hypothetical protein
LLAGCGQKVRRDTSIDQPVPVALPDSILGERVKGRTEVRAEPGGAVLFTLNDSTLVTCGKAGGGWYPVGLQLALPTSAHGTDTLRKGRALIVSGKAVGVVARDLYVSLSSTGKESWTELTGYVPKDRIYPFSVIEEALAGYMDTVKGRTVEALQPFITSFALEPFGELKPYDTYFTYESWIEDPSPLPRVQLVFFDNRLIGVVHSRPLEISHAADHQLERGFRVLFFEETPKEVKEDFTKQFNHFITSVD